MAMKVLRGLCIPFTIGNPSKGTFIFTDGNISSTVVSACVIPLLIIATVLTWVEEEWKSPYLRPRYQILFALYIMSTVSTMGLSIAIFRNRTGWLKLNSNIDLSMKPKLLFLWLFGICIAVNASLNLTNNINCIANGTTDTQTISAVDHIVALLFYCGQLLFLSYFVNYTLIPSIVLNYCMSCMLITHVMEWLNVVLVTFSKILTPANHTFNSSDCFWKSDFNNFRESITPFVIPAETEFSLLAAALILRIWILSSENNSPSTETMPEENVHDNDNIDERRALLSTQYRTYQNGGQRESSTNSAECNKLSVDISNGNNEGQKQRNIEFQEDGMKDLDEETVAIENGNHFNREYVVPRPSGYFYITILLGLVLSLPMFVGTIYSIVVIHESTFTRATVLEITRITYTIIHFLTIVITYNLMRNNCRRKLSTRRFSGKDYIIILCTGGAVAFMSLKLFAGVKVLHADQHFMGTLIVTQAVLDILTIYLQTVLIFHSDQYKTGNRTRAFEYIYLFAFLSIINILLWLNDTIASSHNRKTSEIPYTVYGEIYWSLTVEILFPFTIFYRFHSSMDMYEKYREFQIQHGN